MNNLNIYSLFLSWEKLLTLLRSLHPHLLILVIMVLSKEDHTEISRACQVRVNCDLSWRLLEGYGFLKKPGNLYL